MPRPSADLTGSRFGKLTVLRRQRIRYGAYGWLCHCDCGREVAIITSSLTRGLSRSCGCARVSPFAKHPGRYKKQPRDLTGQIFGRLTVIEYVENRKGHRVWKCRCSCGQEGLVYGNNLRRGNTTSCGCQRRENAKRLLAAGTQPTYSRFCRRCGAPYLGTARQLYCTPTCTQFHEPAQIHCVICGTLCAAKDGRRYCGAGCLAAAKKRQATARVERNRFMKIIELGAELDRRLDQPKKETK